MNGLVVYIVVVDSMVKDSYVWVFLMSFEFKKNTTLNNGIYKHAHNTLPWDMAWVEQKKVFLLKLSLDYPIVELTSMKYNIDVLTCACSGLSNTTCTCRPNTGFNVIVNSHFRNGLAAIFGGYERPGTRFYHPFSTCILKTFNIIGSNWIY